LLLLLPSLIDGENKDLQQASAYEDSLKSFAVVEAPVDSVTKKTT